MEGAGVGVRESTLRAWGLNMRSGSEEGSYVRLIDFLHHSTLGSREIKKKGLKRVALGGREAFGRRGRRLSLFLSLHSRRCCGSVSFSLFPSFSLSPPPLPPSSLSLPPSLFLSAHKISRSSGSDSASFRSASVPLPLAESEPSSRRGPPMPPLPSPCGTWRQRGLRAARAARAARSCAPVAGIPEPSERDQLAFCFGP